MIALSADALSNGLELEKDLVLADRPSDPAMRESVNIWLFEDSGAFGFPRMGIEAIGALWDNRPFQANFAFADGRVLDGTGQAPPPPSSIGPDGRPTIMGAGPLTFECLEPFRRWKVTYDGEPIDTSGADMIAQRIDPERRVRARLEAELTMVTPAWIQIMDPSDTRPEAEYMGIGWRFEHLFLAEGFFEVGGERQPFKGRGSRIHRQSVRNTDTFYGHCWQSAVFPDGRAFGINAYPPRPDGEQYNTGYIYRDGQMYDAKVTDAPWLRRIVYAGEDVTVELESELGRTRIGGSTVMSTFRFNVAEMGGLTLYQGGARYTWDDQVAVGMIERSSPTQQLTFA